MNIIERYIILRVRHKRLMTQNARSNRDRCNLLREEFKALEATGGVPQSVIDGIGYISALGPVPSHPDEDYEKEIECYFGSAYEADIDEIIEEQANR